MNREFVNYLNTLQNEQAGNSNAIAEAQQTNPLYQKVKIERYAATYLAKRIESETQKPCLIILTGHAGDGKTTLLYQTLEKVRAFDGQIDIKKRGDSFTQSGKKIHYVKDFSELSKGERIEEIREALARLEDQYTILVANTGPLIEAFRSAFPEREDAESLIINRMDTIDDYESNIYGYSILVLNVAKIDNTEFIEAYARKITDETNWKGCVECSKRDKCPIYFNATLARDNPHIFRFVKDFYIWEQEHGRRATIRQISAHLAYSITGGLNCDKVLKSVNKNWRSRYLLSELLFGRNTNSQIQGVRWLQMSKIDSRKTQKDYDLFVRKAYVSLIPDALKDIWEYIEQLPVTCAENKRAKGMTATEKRRFLKRMMIVFSWDTEKEIYRDLFSPYYTTFLKIRTGEQDVDKNLRTMVFNAISVIFTGEKPEATGNIYLTMRRRGERVQNVQMQTGCIYPGQLKLKRRLIKSDAVEAQKNEIFLIYQAYGRTVEFRVSLPMLNYFEKVSRGMIITDIDPILSHGIESLKAQLMAACSMEDTDENTVCLLVRTDDGWTKRELKFNRDKIIEE